MKKSDKTKKFLFGILVGAVNSLLGAGGGMVAVPLLRHGGLTQKQAQASSVAVILPLSLISAGIYWDNFILGNIPLAVFIISGIFGAIAGSSFLNRISDRWLRLIFGIFVIWAGIRMIK